MMSEVEKLRSELKEKEEEIQRLRSLLDQRIGVVKSDDEIHRDMLNSLIVDDRLDNKDIARYGRQLILTDLGVKGQLKLKQTSVLIAGCGGLGCPAAVYLASAGIGRIGLADYDTVELNNLHRQILHCEIDANADVSKALSAARACHRVNSRVQCDVLQEMLSASNALDVIRNYDIVVDATDNVASRYLLSDACVLSGRPLVSGGALRFEGQLTVYNYCGSPCYRCLYPQPPPAEMVTNCADGGVLGAVVGVIGTLQAVEVVKIAAGIGKVVASRLILYDGLDGTFRCTKLRGRQKNCLICGDSPTITKLVDYESFCGASATDKSQPINVLSSSDRILTQDYAGIVERNEPHILVDVRSPVELEITKLPTTTHNVPMEEFNKPEGYSSSLVDLGEDVKRRARDTDIVPVFVVCRRGNDSQVAVQKFKSYFAGMPVQIRDIVGGLTAWSKNIDPNFPIY